MDNAAELLGLSTVILQRQYKEVYGKMNDPKADITISSACDDIHDDIFTLEDDIQSEDISQDMQTQYTTRSGRKTKKVLNEECESISPSKEDEKLARKSKKRKIYHSQSNANDPELERQVNKRWRKGEEDDDDYEPEDAASGTESDKETSHEPEKLSKAVPRRQELKDLVVGCQLNSICVSKTVCRLKDKDNWNLNPLNATTKHCADNKFRWRRRAWTWTYKKEKSKQLMQRPYFAVIIGVKLCQDDVDSSIIEVKGELLKGRPLAWSFPENVEDLDKQYDAVTRAYRQVLGFSEEELYCNKMYDNYGFRNDFGRITDDTRRKQAVRPRTHVEEKLSRSFRCMSKEKLQSELKERQREPRADQRITDIPTIALKHEQCRVQLDRQLEDEHFEGLMALVWHKDGSVLGKILNFDNKSEIFIGLLRDVWVGVSDRLKYNLPFSEHILSRHLSVCERAMAPKLLQQLIDGSAPSRICPTCGDVFTILVETDNERFDKHVDKHIDKQVVATCGCEGVEKINTQVGLQRHNKLYHSDGSYVQCPELQWADGPRCPEVFHKMSRGELENHIRGIHRGSAMCEECGQTFVNSRKYQVHFYYHHTLVPCQTCGIEVIGFRNMGKHLRENHRGDPLPCPECGVNFADKKNLERHKRIMHRAKEQKRYQCPYAECDKAFDEARLYLNHLNNIHFNVYVYICEFNCPGAKYKDESNVRSHYKKKHDQKPQGLKPPTLEELLKTMTVDQRVYHESILQSAGHFKDLVERVGCGSAHSYRYVT